MTKAVFCGAALALFACLSGQPGHAESGVAATIPDRAFFLYRPGDKTMENVVRTDERYGHDALFFGPRGWDYWNWLQDPRPIQNPNLWPDTQSTYFLSRFALPAGSTLTLHGTYPHARYFEFALYKFEHGTFVAVGEALRGQDIAPDPGATNPFLVGADRLAGVRDFTLRIVAADAPAGARATNTLYVGQDGGELQAALRIYLSDPGYDGAGWGPATAPFAGRGLPSYEGRLADGTRLSAAEVAARWAQPMAATKPAMTVVEWEGLLHAKNNDPALDPASAPARNPPEWQKFWTLRYSLLGAFKPPALRARIPYEGAMEGGGDPYTQYMIVYLSRKFGPVYVMHGKMPSFPDTFAGEDGKPLAIMPDAQVQVLVDRELRVPAVRPGRRRPHRHAGAARLQGRLHDRGEPPRRPAAECDPRERRGVAELGHARRGTRYPAEPHRLGDADDPLRRHQPELGPEPGQRHHARHRSLRHGALLPAGRVHDQGGLRGERAEIEQVSRCPARQLVYPWLAAWGLARTEET